MPVRSKLFALYAIFVSLYAASFLIPRQISTISQYELSNLQYRLLSLSVLIPFAFIWYAALYGYANLRAYTILIAGTPDGRHIAKITTGVVVLAFGLPINAIISSGLVILGQEVAELATVSAIIKNYVSLLFPLIGFIWISRGAFGLGELSKQRASQKSLNLLALFFVAISVAYNYVIDTSASLDKLYHLPTWLILLTVVVPYLYTWYLGLSSAYQIHLYARKAPGVLYRKTWNMLASGLGGIIIMQIAVQYIGTATVQFSSLRFVRLLVMVYVLLVLMAVGYLLVALGAKRLRKIEEV